MDTPTEQNELDPQVAALLKTILSKKSLDLITPSERIFLKARREYLNDDQRRRYASIIGITVDEDLDRQEEENKVNEPTYNEIFAKAVSLGYKGKREKKPILLAFIEQHQP